MINKGIVFSIGWLLIFALGFGVGLGVDPVDPATAAVS